MLRFAIATTLVLATASAAFAVQDIDGSYAALPSAAQAATERLVTETFRDPVSAQFRRVRLITSSRDQVICGEVNFKNGFGAYVGFEQFAIAKHPDGKTSTYNPHTMSPEARPLMRRIVREVGCGTNGEKPVLESPSAEVPALSTPLLKRWATENEACRGGAGDEQVTYDACERRDRVSAQLRSQNFCYGREGEAGYQQSWHLCGPGSRRR